MRSANQTPSPQEQTTGDFSRSSAAVEGAGLVPRTPPQSHLQGAAETLLGESWYDSIWCAGLPSGRSALPCAVSSPAAPSPSCSTPAGRESQEGVRQRAPRPCTWLTLHDPPHSTERENGAAGWRRDGFVPLSFFPGWFVRAAVFLPGCCACISCY